MRRHRRNALVLGGCWLLVGSVAAADKERAEIPEVAPVAAGGVRFQAPPFTRVAGLPRNGGYVEAIDIASGRRLWLVDVVGPQPDDGKEGDKQDLFLTELRLSADGRALLLADEAGRRYRMDLATRKVRALSAR